MATIYSNRNLALANETGLLTQKNRPKYQHRNNFILITFATREGDINSYALSYSPIHLLLTHFLIFSAQSVSKSKGVSFQSNCGATSVGYAGSKEISPLVTPSVTE